MGVGRIERKLGVRVHRRESGILQVERKPGGVRGSVIQDLIGLRFLEIERKLGVRVYREPRILQVQRKPAHASGFSDPGFDRFRISIEVGLGVRLRVWGTRYRCPRVSGFGWKVSGFGSSRLSAHLRTDQC